jgi:hypothetical protein
VSKHFLTMCALCAAFLLCGTDASLFAGGRSGGANIGGAYSGGGYSGGAYSGGGRFGAGNSGRGIAYSAGFYGGGLFYGDYLTGGGYPGYFAPNSYFRPSPSFSADPIAPCRVPQVFGSAIPANPLSFPK